MNLLKNPLVVNLILKPLVQMGMDKIKEKLEKKATKKEVESLNNQLLNLKQQVDQNLNLQNDSIRALGSQANAIDTKVTNLHGTVFSQLK